MLNFMLDETVHKMWKLDVSSLSYVLLLMISYVPLVVMEFT